ncbi:protoporphyrinogen oxidase [bacterium]|nr:MAG: protoporphyrinogen oxidase [bacterium]
MRICIIGSGITGLSLAHFLKKNNHEVTLIESRNTVGGPVQSTSDEDFLYEHGPNSLLLTSDSIKELINDLSLQGSLLQAKPEAKNRYIVKNGRLVSLPTSIGAFLKTTLFSWKAKLRLLKEPFISAGTNPNESLGDFVERRLGIEFLDYAINPFVAGVYAGDPKKLGVRHAFAKLYDLEQKYGSLIKGQFKGAKERKKRGEVAKDRAPMVSFKNGLAELINALENELQTSIHKGVLIDQIHKVHDGWSILFNHSDASIDVDVLIITIPAYRLTELNFSYLKADQRELFKQVYYPSVTVVHTGYKRDSIQHPLDGFGYLTPEKEQRQILGGLFSSSIFDARAPKDAVLITSFIGGARQPEVALKEDAELVDIVYKEHQDLLGATEKPVFTHIVRWPKSIPQYTTNYDEFKTAVKQMEDANLGLIFSGNWVKGISLSDCITKAFELADSIK